MAYINGVLAVNGSSKDGPTDQEMEEGGSVPSTGTDEIPPAELHEDPEHIQKITIPLNDTTAWKPRRKLRVVTIGAGYSGMIFAQKLQHKYLTEMEEILDHVIYEAREDVGGTWDANTYPGIMCDVPSAIYVSWPSHSYSDLYSYSNFHFQFYLYFYSYFCPHLRCYFQFYLHSRVYSHSRSYLFSYVPSSMT